MLDARGASVTYIHYLDTPPTREDIEVVMGALGIESPRAMMRTKESLYGELQLGDADDEALMQAMLAHPVLIERPIVIRGSRAVIARPPEKLEALFRD